MSEMKQVVVFDPFSFLTLGCGDLHLLIFVITVFEIKEWGKAYNILLTFYKMLPNTVVYSKNKLQIPVLQQPYTGHTVYWSLA